MKGVNTVNEFTEMSHEINEINKDLDALTIEVVKLEERVKALEKAQTRPDNAFWAQLMFDAFLFVVAVKAIVVFLGG